MNNDLISRSELKKALSENITILTFNVSYDGILAEIIDNAPTVEMPQGEWIAQGKEYIECDNCNTWFKKRYLPYGNFCCKCGAKMKERTKTDTDM